jgi:hypothetical protein
MANPPHGWDHPELPMYPGGPVPSGPVARSTLPTAMRRVGFLMCAGAAIGLISGIVDGLTTHNVVFYTYSSASSTTATVHYTSSYVAGIIQGIIGGGIWLWMTWKTRAGRKWARVLSSVFFGFLSLQFFGGIFSLAGSGGAVAAFSLILVEWGVGLAALIGLWQRESSEFFAFAK